MNSKFNTGFTLIELLVVIAIISVLAGFLFPVFASTRERARQIACLSNARQMGIALQQYTSDNDDRFMTRHDNDAGDTSSANVDPSPADFQTWFDWVQPYINSYAVERCPSYTGPYPIENDAYTASGVVKRYSKSNYLINDNVITTAGVAKGALAAIPYPSSTLLVAESPSGATYFSDAGTGVGPTSTNPGPTGVDDLMCPVFVNGFTPVGSGSMHFVQFIPNAINPNSGIPAISARVTCIAVDGHAQSVYMNNANEGGVTQVGNLVLDQQGGYGGLYVTGPTGELTIPHT